MLNVFASRDDLKAAVAAWIYGPERCEEDGDADVERRVYEKKCAKLGLTTLPTYTNTMDLPSRATSPVVAGPKFSARPGRCRSASGGGCPTTVLVVVGAIAELAAASEPCICQAEWSPATRTVACPRMAASPLRALATGRGAKSSTPAAMKRERGEGGRTARRRACLILAQRCRRPSLSGLPTRRRPRRSTGTSPAGIQAK